MSESNLRTAALTCTALLGFAANSLLCRMALGPGTIDAASFTTIRLLSGAVVLVLLARTTSDSGNAERGSWLSGVALFGYAVAFSFAYLRLGTGTGALILFGAVQATMIGWGLFSGERPRPAEWIGLAIALGGLVVLTLPGLTAPDPLGAALMAVSGIGWGVYSMRGRGIANPLRATAGNFVRTLPLAAICSLLAFSSFEVSPSGVLLACASGAIASGIGYSLWYAALRNLSATRAAIVQLSVPVLAAAAGIAVLGEVVSHRLLVAGAVILGGVAVAVLGKSLGARSG